MSFLGSALRQKIEARFGKSIRYSKDCDALSKNIEKTCNERISTTTLKRLFGFAKSIDKPRLYTLDVLANYIGYKDWSSALAETKASQENKDTIFNLIINKSKNDFHLLQHQLLHCLSTNSIEIKKIENLCRQFGKSTEITSFIIELINLASRTKNLLFLKNIFSLSNIFNEKYHDQAHIYYISQAIGLALRNNPDLSTELATEYAQNLLAQKYFVEWFVDEDNLQGYYGKLLELYHQHKKRSISSRLFYYALMYSTCLQKSEFDSAQEWYNKIKLLNVQHPIHPILAGRYFGILLSETKNDSSINFDLLDNTFKQYLFSDLYENAIAFMLYMCRYLFINKKNQALIVTVKLFEGYWKKATTKYKTHWGSKTENELNIYLAYTYFLNHSQKQAKKIIEGVDSNLFEIFMYKQIHEDYMYVSGLLLKNK